MEPRTIETVARNTKAADGVRQWLLFHTLTENASMLGGARVNTIVPLIREDREPPAYFWTMIDKADSSESLRDGAIYDGTAQGILSVREFGR